MNFKKAKIACLKPLRIVITISTLFGIFTGYNVINASTAQEQSNEKDISSKKSVDTVPLTIKIPFAATTGINDDSTLDDLTKKQLNLLLQLPAIFDTILRANFDKPETKAAKEKIAALLDETSKSEPDLTYGKYLKTLSAAILANSFYSTSPAPNNLKANKTEIVITPNLDTNDPRMFNLFIYVNDQKETRRIADCTARFDKVQSRLNAKTVAEYSYTSGVPRLQVARLVYASRPDALLMVYPTPEMIEKFNYSDKAYKIIIFKNLIQGYVDSVLTPLGRKLFGMASANPNSSPTDTDSVITFLAMHRMSHAVGNIFVISPRKKSDDASKGKRSKDEIELQYYSEIAGDRFIPMEDIKTGTVAASSFGVLREDRLISFSEESTLYNTYLILLFDQLRKDLAGEKTSTPAAITQLNYLMKKGAVNYNLSNQQLFVQFLFFRKTVEEFAQYALQRGNTLFEIMSNNSQITPELQKILDNVKDVPQKVNFQL